MLADILRLLQTRRTNDLTADEVRKQLENGDTPQLLDVRTPGEFRTGHLPGAILMPVAEIAQRHHELDPDRDIIAYCKTSARSRRACGLLAKLGYTNVYNMTGGITVWSRLHS